MQDTQKRAVCSIGKTFFEGRCDPIPGSRWQANSTVTKFWKPISSFGGTLWANWNGVMSPLSESCLWNETDRCFDSRVKLFEIIVNNAEEHLKEFLEGTLPGKVESRD